MNSTQSSTIYISQSHRKLPQADLAALEHLINDCGYHRREQLADATSASLHLREQIGLVQRIPMPRDLSVSQTRNFEQQHAGKYINHALEKTEFSVFMDVEGLKRRRFNSRFKRFACQT